ncbi:MAG: hypothetical protein AB2747_05845 [Candidatus Thiodiazotropha taylori]
MDENKKSGYEAAIKLTDKTARTIWSVYTALLASNAFLLSFAAFIAPILSSGGYLVRLVGLLGMLICIAWFLITMRNFDFYKYYFAWARKYEEEAFGEDVTMIRNGESFAKGNDVNDLGIPIRLRWASRLFRVEWLVYVVILSFLTIYGYLTATV